MFINECIRRCMYLRMDMRIHICKDMHMVMSEDMGKTSIQIDV